MARPKATQAQGNEEKTQEVKAEAKKQEKKSKVGKFYQKIQYFESSRDTDQTTTFDLKGQSKVLCTISLPEEHANRLNKSAKYSGIYYKEV